MRAQLSHLKKQAGKLPAYSAPWEEWMDMIHGLESQIASMERNAKNFSMDSMAEALINTLCEGRDDLQKLPIPALAKKYARRHGLKAISSPQNPRLFQRVNAKLVNPGKPDKFKNYDAGEYTMAESLIEGSLKLKREDAKTKAAIDDLKNKVEHLGGDMYALEVDGGHVTAQIYPWYGKLSG
jgi:hypothetical protein